MDGTRPPAVLVHGLAGSARWWSRNLDALAADRRVVPLELPGFGWRHLRFGLGAAAGALGTTVARERRPVDLVGHSLGGLLAARLAAARPALVRKLVLVAPAGGAPGTLRAWLLPAAATVGSSSPRVLALATAGTLRAGPVSLLAASRALLADGATGDLRGIEAPTLLVWGERDRLVPPSSAERYLSALPEARLVVLPRTGHVPMHERADEFNALLRSFLDAV